MVGRRTCVGCRKIVSYETGIRLRAPEGRLTLSAKVGRGAWICYKSSGCLDLAFSKGKLSRALRCELDRESVIRVRAELLATSIL